MYLQLNRVRHFLICTQNCARKSIWFFKIYTLSPIYVQIVKVYQHPSEPVTMNSFMLVVEKPGGVGDCKSQLTGCLVKCILCIPILICTPPPKKKKQISVLQVMNLVRYSMRTELRYQGQVTISSSHNERQAQVFETFLKISDRKDFDICFLIIIII